MSAETEYKSYLLRLWKVNGVGNEVWRASLEDAHTGARLGFSSLQRLFAFLEDQTGSIARSEANPGSTDGRTHLL
jgi:hypothetical protein